MITACGFLAGQRGDLIQCTVACRAFKEQYPNSHLTFCMGKPYEDMLPLFKNHPYIDDLHVWQGYEPWPQPEDKRFLEEKKFDIVYNPFSQHKDNSWFNNVPSQTFEVCRMVGLKPPEDLSCYLEKWFEPVGIGANTVCINPWTAAPDKKDIPKQKWEDIVKFIKKKGYQAAQLSAPNDESIFGAWRPSIGRTYFDSVKTLLSSKLLITLDGGLSWVASAYKHPVLGLYGIHYPGQINSKSYQPINPNAIYLEASHANDICMGDILDVIDHLI